MLEILRFKDGFFIGFLAWFFVLFCVGLIAGEIADSKEMKKQHCVKTDKTREVEYTRTVLVGKVPVTQHGTNTEYLYTCDDEPRWR